MSNNNQRRVDKAHTPEKRPPRVRIGQGGKLDLPQSVKDDAKKRGLHLHWFLDKAGEIEGAKAAWYEHFEIDGRKFTVPAGEGKTHHLMCIKQELYDEDMAAQQELVTKTTHDAVKVKTDQGEYSPEGESQAVTRDRDIV